MDFQTYVTLVFNGKAGAGKDTIAEAVKRAVQDKHLKATHMAFKDNLVEVTKRFYNISDADWDFLSLPEFKNKAVFPYDYSYREMLIYVSEEVIKPVFGRDIWGRLAAQTVVEEIEQRDVNVTIVSDCGFDEELEGFYLEKRDIFLAPLSKTIFVQIIGEGWGDVGDSRSNNLTEKAKELDIPTLTLHYEKTERGLEKAVESILKEIDRDGSAWRDEVRNIKGWYRGDIFCETSPYDVVEWVEGEEFDAYKF